MENNLKVPTEIYSRVVGYFRPVNNWNLGQRSQYEDRLTLDQDKIKKFTEEV